MRENLAFPLKSPLLQYPRKRKSKASSPSVAETLQISAQARQQAPPSSRAAKCSGYRSVVRWYVRRISYLMDEPLSSLDAKLRADLRIELKRIQANLGATLLYVDPRPDRGDDHGHPRRCARRGPTGAVRAPPREIYETRSAFTRPAASASRASTCCRPTCSRVRRPRRRIRSA